MPERRDVVLVAEDDDGYRFAIRNILEDFGFEVREAENKQQLLDQASDAKLWIVDARLPTAELEGIQAVRELLTGPQPFACPVIFISVLPRAFCDRELATLTSRGVRFDWVEKPFELEYLLDKVRLALGESKP